MRRRQSKRGSLLRALLSVLCGGVFFAPGAGVAQAQDERRVVSPNGELEFRIFVSQPGGSALPRLAYQVRYRGHLAIDTSFLGLNIHTQEPILGENVGLTSSRRGDDSGNYRWLVVEYMQNGSLGRRINLEIRVWDQAAAFRYVIPRSTELNQILIEDEVTEFDVSGRRQHSSLKLPAAVESGNAGWVGLSEVSRPGFPAMSLAPTPTGVLTARLSRGPAYPLAAFEGKTPLVCPWRIVTFAPDREQALHSAPGELSNN